MNRADPSLHYTWLMWASAFLIPWAALFVARRELRRPMLRASVLTAPFGLTEPLFVPAYWHPPSLFDLADRTGFDLASFIFSFALGGLGVACYRALTHIPMLAVDERERMSGQHRRHRVSLLAPFIVFAALVWLPWNPIYAGIVAMTLGAAAAVLCRADLRRCTLFGGAIFLGLYTVFLSGLKWLWPGHIEAVWNLDDLLGWHPWVLPLEELLFGFAFGMYWSSVYEHLSWQRAPLEPRHSSTGSEAVAVRARGSPGPSPSRSVDRH